MLKKYTFNMLFKAGQFIKQHSLCYLFVYMRFCTILYVFHSTYTRPFNLYVFFHIYGKINGQCCIILLHFDFRNKLKVNTNRITTYLAFDPESNLVKKLKSQQLMNQRGIIANYSAERPLRCLTKYHILSPYRRIKLQLNLKRCTGITIKKFSCLFKFFSSNFNCSTDIKTIQ